MEYIFIIAVLIFSVIIHEISHGAMANKLGDPTAKLAGRLTLNPLKHLDPIGSVILPSILIILKSGFIFGWAKPVPVNPNNFSDQKYGQAKVALAGPASNLLIALIFGLLLRFFSDWPILQSFSFAFSYIVYINLLLCIFNLLPVPPLDGSHIFFLFFPAAEKIKIFLSKFNIFILIAFIFFLFPLLSSVVSRIFNLLVGHYL
ncbi:MAG: site-2 protease family protein [bacterium]